MTAKHVRRVVSTAVALALAFGASQALATPSAPKRADTCPLGCRTGGCDCDVYCVDIGGSWGTCSNNVCQCFL
ncbi:MAG TPA: hypothetical protein VF092_23415 [Longimicrobium sp.]